MYESHDCIPGVSYELVDGEELRVPVDTSDEEEEKDCAHEIAWTFRVRAVQVIVKWTYHVQKRWNMRSTMRTEYLVQRTRPFIAIQAVNLLPRSRT